MTVCDSLHRPHSLHTRGHHRAQGYSSLSEDDQALAAGLGPDCTPRLALCLGWPNANKHFDSLCSIDVQQSGLYQDAQRRSAMQQSILCAGLDAPCRPTHKPSGLSGNADVGRRAAPEDVAVSTVL